MPRHLFSSDSKGRVPPTESAPVASCIFLRESPQPKTWTSDVIITQGKMKNICILCIHTRIYSTYGKYIFAPWDWRLVQLSLEKRKKHVIYKTYMLLLCYSHSLPLIENPRESNLCLLKTAASLVKDKCQIMNWTGNT